MTQSTEQSDERFKALFLHNFSRYKQIESGSDNRAVFEALYNCFENAARHSLGDENASGYIRKLRESSEDNLVRISFERLYKQSQNNTFLMKIKKLRSFQPIYNNETGRASMMTKNLPFETFLDVLYTIRNNVRHGQKEFSQRSENIINCTVEILKEYAIDLHKIIHADEIEVQKKIEIEKQKLSEKTTSVAVFILNPFVLLILFWVIILYFLSNNNTEHTRYVDCRKKPEACERLEEKQYEQQQYEDYDWARPY